MCDNSTVFCNSPREFVASAFTQQTVVVVVVAKPHEPSHRFSPVVHNRLKFFLSALDFCVYALPLLKASMHCALYSLCAVAGTPFVPELRCLCCRRAVVRKPDFQLVNRGRFDDNARRLPPLGLGLTHLHSCRVRPDSGSAPILYISCFSACSMFLYVVMHWPEFARCLRRSDDAICHSPRRHARGSRAPGAYCSNRHKNHSTAICVKMLAFELLLPVLHQNFCAHCLNSRCSIISSPRTRRQASIHRNPLKLPCGLRIRRCLIKQV
jgi:hypothetical protein